LQGIALSRLSLTAVVSTAFADDVVTEKRATGIDDT
jgi:hypothetical protein